MCQKLILPNKSKFSALNPTTEKKRILNVQINFELQASFFLIHVFERHEDKR